MDTTRWKKRARKTVEGSFDSLDAFSKSIQREYYRVVPVTPSRAGLLDSIRSSKLRHQYDWTYEKTRVKNKRGETKAAVSPPSFHLLLFYFTSFSSPINGLRSIQYIMYDIIYVCTYLLDMINISTTYKKYEVEATHKK